MNCLILYIYIITKNKLPDSYIKQSAGEAFLK